MRKADSQSGNQWAAEETLIGLQGPEKLPAPKTTGLVGDLFLRHHNFIIESEGAKVHTKSESLKGCLLGQGDFVLNSGLPSFEDRKLAWEASTLPLSYTRSK